ncbi:hypothetical protein LTR10_001977 [Elasticomyces elasticus]|nr:hypothetical protein LTR10_001977 [Elasticomyces elasticus]
MATNTVSRTLPRALKRARCTASTQQTRRVATAAAAVDYHDPAPEYIPPPPLPTTRPSRADTIRDAKPFSAFLTDTHARQHDYLRISLTEKCNLRCLYCMPEEGIALSPPTTQLTTPEIIYISQLFVNQGVTKIRLTGGEPTVRKDILELMRRIGDLRSAGLKELALTTNGISLWRKLDSMVEAGLTGLNISLDTLDPFQFTLLTRRQGFDAVMKSINRVQEMNRAGANIKLKINCVMMRGLNSEQLLPFVEMTREQDIEVRFIEYMPFGGNKWSENKMLPYEEMLAMIKAVHPEFHRVPDRTKSETSKTWQVPGFVGRVGFITSMTEDFCGTCNRLRITSDGNLKVCLHGETEVSLRDLIRKDHGGEPMDDVAFDAIRQIELDRRKGMDGQLSGGEEGWISKERQLLEFIGAAVKRKKERHAGMGELENMRNRPMILIGERATSSRPSSLRRPFSSALSQPWSRIPTHLFSNYPGTASHARYFSTSNRRQSDDTENAGLASRFGFQSLTGLFADEAPRGRYSRPRAETPTPAPKVDELKPDVRNSKPSPKLEETKPGVRNAKPLTGVWKGRSSDEPADQAFFQSAHVAQSSPTVTKSAEGSSATRQTITPAPVAYAPIQVDESRGPKSEDTGKLAVNGRVERDSLAFRRPRSGRDLRPHVQSTRDAAADDYHRAKEEGVLPRPRAPRSLKPRAGRSREVVPDPFAQPSGQRPVVATSKLEPGTRDGAWGLSEDAMQTIDSMNDPHGAPPAISEQEPPAVTVDPEIARTSMRSTSPASEPAKLTHVTSSGEAHMVDVGAKPDTRRVAVAVAYVRFSNPEAFRLIYENSNKKGDVLGTARIAGIMAAKRTSDLIPLCHPIAISKVEVEVNLRAVGGGQSAFTRKRNTNGVVELQAVVETVGPTGVEMEALSAVTGAALTVYDMCKAVDKSMEIAQTRVVYKSGGRSIDHKHPEWARDVGMLWFKKRNLEIPVQVYAEEKKHKKQELDVEDS